MTDVTSRLRLIVDSSGLDRAGRRLRRGQSRARSFREEVQRLSIVLGGVFSARGFVSLADSFTDVENRIRVVTDSADEMKNVIEQIGGVARRTQSSLESTAVLYSRTVQFSGEFFENQKQTLDFIEAINNAFLASGATVTEASNAIRQLTQGLSSGELRGEEFRSVSEQATALARAIEEVVGDGITSIFELAEQGAFTTDVVIQAVLDNFEKFQEMASNVTPTISRALVSLRTQFLLVFGDDLQVGAEALSKSILLLADNMGTLAVALEAAAVAGTAFIATAKIASGVKSLKNISSGIKSRKSSELFLEKTLGAPNDKIAAKSVRVKNLQRALTGLRKVLGTVAKRMLTLNIVTSVAVGAFALFRDEISMLVFGVKDFDAVMQATLKVLGPKISKFFSSLGKAIRETINWLVSFIKQIGSFSLAFFVDLGRVIGILFDSLVSTLNVDIDKVVNKLESLASSTASFLIKIIPPEAFEHVRNFGRFVIDVFVNVAESIAELIGDAVLLPIRAIQGLYNVLGNIKILPGGIQSDLQQAAAAIKGFADVIDNNSGRETIAAIGVAAKATIDGVKSAAVGTVEAYKEIRVLAKDISTDGSGLAKAVSNLSEKVVQAKNIVTRIQSGIASVVTSNLDSDVKDKLVISAKAAIEEIQRALDVADLAKDSGNLDKIAAAMKSLKAATSTGAEEVMQLKNALKGASDEFDKVSDSAQILADFYKDIADQQALVEAARLGEREERVAREFLSIRRQIKDITVEEARALAEQNVLLDEQLDRIREQRAIIEAPFENLADNLENAIINGGEGGIDGLKNTFKSFFKDIESSFLRKLLDPFLNQIRNAANNIPISDSLAATPTGFKKFLSGIPGIGSIFKGGVGTPPINPNGGPINVGQGGLGAGQLAGVFAQISKLAAPIAANFAGFRLGSSIGSAVRPNANPDNQKIGGLLAGGIGAFLGSLFGGKSDKVGQVVFRPQTGSILGSDQKDNSQEASNNFRIASEISDQVSTVVSEIVELTGGAIRDLAATSHRDDLINVAAGDRDGIRIGFQGQNGEIAQSQTFKNTEQGAADAVEAGVRLALKNLSGDGALVDIAKSLSAANAPLEDIATVLDTLNDVTRAGQPPISEYKRSIENLNNAIDRAMDAANGSAVAEQELSAAREAGMEAIRNQFNDDIARRFLDQTDPLRAAFDDLSESIKTILSDAEVLGVTTGQGSNVLKVIVNDLDSFFTQALDNGTSISDLTSRLSEFKEVLMDIGVSSDAASRALEQAAQKQRETFDEQIQSDIGRFLDGPINRLNDLLKSQAERLEAAEAIGANLEEVARLTQLEQMQFFEGLSEQALDEISGFFGLFEEASNEVSRNLDLSRQDLRDRADQFGDFANNFASLSTQFNEQFIAASPGESLSVLRGRANELLSQIGLGNESAAQALPQVLQQLVDNARQTFGNTTGFSDILNFAQETLAAAEDAALTVQSDAERQIQALDASVDILSDIRDILDSQQAINALFNSVSTGGVASSDELLQLIQQGVGLTPANDNLSTVSITGIIAQSLRPVVEPFTSAIGSLTGKLEPMPALQQLTIDAINQASDSIVNSLDEVVDRLERIERVNTRMLTELENAA